jgi:hypothetical protein
MTPTDLAKIALDTHERLPFPQCQAARSELLQAEDALRQGRYGDALAAAERAAAKLPSVPLVGTFRSQVESAAIAAGVA